MARVELGARLDAGALQRQLGQFGHGARDHGQRRLLLAVEHHGALHDQLAQHTQRSRQVQATLQQCHQGLLHGRALGRTRRQKAQLVAIATVQPLVKTGIGGLCGDIQGRTCHCVN